MFDTLPILRAGYRANGQEMTFEQGDLETTLTVLRGDQQVINVTDEGAEVVGLQRVLFVLRETLLIDDEPFEIAAGGKFTRIENGRRKVWEVIPDSKKTNDQDDDNQGEQLRVPCVLASNEAA